MRLPSACSGVTLPLTIGVTPGLFLSRDPWHPPRRMFRKPPRPESDIETLADELRARLRHGDSIEAWMRRNVAKLTRLVRDQGWRWDDVGAAMTRAGISYSTGRAWTPEVLRVKASEARAQIRARRERNRATTPKARAAPPLKPQVPATQPLDQGHPTPVPAEPARPKFALAQIVSRHETPPKALTEPADSTTPAPPPKHDADAVMRRFFRTDPSKE